MATRFLTEPAAEPVSLAEARQWCRIDTTTEDALIVMLITALRRKAEELTGRAFVQRTLEMTLDCFECGMIRLPYPPLVSVDYVRYIDSDGTLQTLDTSPMSYRYWTTCEPGILAPLHGEAWPITRCEPEAVRIGFTAGYAAVAKCPPELKVWMQARVSTLFENREELVQNNQIEIPGNLYDGLLDGLIIGDRLIG